MGLQRWPPQPRKASISGTRLFRGFHQAQVKAAHELDILDADRIQLSRELLSGRSLPGFNGGGFWPQIFWTTIDVPSALSQCCKCRSLNVLRHVALSTTTRVVHDSRAQRTTLPSIFLRRLFLDAASPLRRHPDARPACFCTPSWSSAAWWPDELEIANGFSGRDGTCDRRGSSGFPPAETRWDLYPPSLERARARQGSDLRPGIDLPRVDASSALTNDPRFEYPPKSQPFCFKRPLQPATTCQAALEASRTRTNSSKIHGQVDLLRVCSARLPHAFRVYFTALSKLRISTALAFSRDSAAPGVRFCSPKPARAFGPYGAPVRPRTFSRHPPSFATYRSRLRSAQPPCLLHTLLKASPLSSDNLSARPGIALATARMTRQTRCGKRFSPYELESICSSAAAAGRPFENIHLDISLDDILQQGLANADRRAASEDEVLNHSICRWRIVPLGRLRIPDRQVPIGTGGREGYPGRLRRCPGIAMEVGIGSFLQGGRARGGSRSGLRSSGSAHMIFKRCSRGASVERKNPSSDPMPDQATQTEQSIIDAMEREFKQEAIAYVEGRGNGPPSAGMLRWLAPHLLSNGTEPTRELEMTAKEAEEVMRMKQETLERMVLTQCE
ncbi:hypothetical protein C8R47DRAFT_1079080 [Mycena vitilis]|nr:hypothetical protein C8R47DRAFT_1079080 [Mycena vitilis]